MPVSKDSSAMRRPDIQTWLTIVAVLAAGLVLRLILWNTQAGVSVEGALSMLTAKAMGSGMAWGHPQPIGYAFLIRMFGAFGGSELQAARSLDLSAGMVSMVLVWLTAERLLKSRRLALLPVVAMAFMPLMVRYSLGTQPEMVYLALILGVVVSVLYERPLVAGALLGFAVQIRPEALLILAGLSFSVGRKRSLSLLFLAAGLSFFVIWMLQGLLLLDWSPFPQVIQNVTTHWMDRDQSGESGASGWIGSVFALLGNTLRYGGFWVPVLALAALLRSGPLLIAALLPALISPFIDVGGHPRFVVPFLPFLWILATLWVERSQGRRRVMMAMVCCAGFALSAAVNIPEAYTVQEDGKYPELQLAGKWLKDYARPDNVVTGEMPLAAYYAGTRYVPLPQGDLEYDDAVDAIVASGADFAVFHQQALKREVPVLTPLVEDKAIVWHENRLEPVYFNNGYFDGRTLVYRVVRPGGPAPLPTEGPTMRRQIGAISHGKDHQFHARVAMRAKKWDTAAEEYRLASNRNPGSPKAAFALNNRAWCLLQAGQYDKAKSEAGKAIRALPQNPDFIDTMIEIVKAMGQDRAVAYWQKKLEAAKATKASESGSVEGP